jgi:PAS domain S-box-containing protein
MTYNPAHRPAWSRYVIAVLAVALAAAVRGWLLGTLGTRVPFITFYRAVILASLYGGLPGGLLATALSALTAAFAWMEPVYQFSIRDPIDWLSLAIFVMSCAAISLVTQAMQSAQARTLEAEAQVRLATERGRAAEELRRYQLLSEHSRDIFLYIRRDDGRILEANAAAAASYGYTRGELQSLSIHQLRADSTQEMTAGQMTEADSGGILFETVHQSKDGSTFPVEVSSQGATIGGIRMLISVIRDITERKRSEQALRESEARLRTLGDHLPEGAIYRYRQDANGQSHFDFISAGIERITGVPAAEFMRDFGAVERSMVAEDLDRLRAAIRLSSEGLTRFEVEVRHKHCITGEIRWSLLRSTPARCPDGSTVWDGIELDITERRRGEEALRASEEALRESETRYRRLVDLAPEALLVQQDGKIAYCNEAAARLYGAENAEKLLGTGMFDRVHPSDLPAVLERIRRAEQGARLPVRESRHLRLDGSEVAVETTAGPVEWHGRRAMLVFVRDITERRNAEARLRDAQKLESLGLLAGGVAHDFNNLLVGVIGNASLAREMIPPDHPAAELLDGVLKTGEQAAHLTRQMLAYSGQGRFVVEPLDLSDLIPEMSVLVGPAISKKIAQRLDLARNLPAIEADRGQVQQVFMNLVVNAAEAIDTSEGLITVRTGVMDVDEAYHKLRPETAGLLPGRHVYLEVRDTGCGMDEATRARIFDPFFSTKFVGRGLGLAAVAGILRGHKGAITVDSAPGEGSCFTVLFPAAARPAIRPPAAAPTTSLQGAGVVLIVDDERMVREMLKKSLLRYGYEVLLADSGLSAIDLLSSYPGEIALVLLDLSMPHMNGGEVLPELRKIRPDLKVILTSGYSESEAMSLLHGQSVTGFLQKPYTAKSVAEKLKLYLGQATHQ